jgi:hypothetical protein
MAPASILEPQKSITSQQSAPEGDVIPEGRRHRTMLSIAGALRARRLSPEMVLSQLRTANERQCHPPLDDAELQKLAVYVGSKAPGFPGQRIQETSCEVELESFSDVTAEKVRWLWPGRVPLGKLTLFVGDPGKGKSLVTLDIASRMSRGIAFPDGVGCQIADSIFLSAEDDAADTIRPRLDAAGADVSRIHRVKMVKVVLSDGEPAESAFNLERDLEKLEDSVKKIPGTQAIVIDPVTAYVGRIDTHRDSDVRRILAPLSELASRLRLAVFGIMHLKKSDTSALLRVSGSIGFVAAARVVWEIMVLAHSLIQKQENEMTTATALAPQAKTPASQPATAEEMAGKTLVFILTFSGIGNRRKVDTKNIEIDADKKWIGVSKKLIDAKELQKITSLDGEIRRYIEARALPSTIKRGVYLMPVSFMGQHDRGPRSAGSFARHDCQIQAAQAPDDRICRIARIVLHYRLRCESAWTVPLNLERRAAYLCQETGKTSLVLSVRPRSPMGHKQPGKIIASAKNETTPYASLLPSRNGQADCRLRCLRLNGSQVCATECATAQGSDSGHALYRIADR